MLNYQRVPIGMKHHWNETSLDSNAILPINGLAFFGNSTVISCPFTIATLMVILNHPSHRGIAIGRNHSGGDGDNDLTQNLSFHLKKYRGFFQKCCLQLWERK